MTEQYEFLNSLSTEQYNIVTDLSPSVACNACPGSGKTRTTISRIKFWQNEGHFGNMRVLMMCFNKSIEKEWASKKLGIETATSHSIGKKLLYQITGNYAELDFDKYSSLYNLTFKESNILSGIRRNYLFNENSKSVLENIIRRALIEGEYTDADEIQHAIKKIYNAWRKGVNILSTTINFDDMLFGPFELLAKNPNLENKIIIKYDLIVIDEQQDLSKYQWMLLDLLGVENLWTVGDESQSIFGWNGADFMLGRAYADKFSCQRFDLYESWRCPQVVAEYASQYVPSFKARRNNSKGFLDVAPKNDVSNFPLKDNTAIICRSNAPLVQTAFKLIDSDVEFQFSKPVSKSIIGLLRSRTNPKMSILSARVMFESFYDERSGILKTEELEMTEKEVEQFEIAFTLLGEKNQRRFPKVSHLIEHLKKIDKSTSGVTLSSIHQAKGLEWDNVIALEHHKLHGAATAGLTMSPHNEMMNLAYVQTTRAKHSMAFRTLDNITDSKL